MKDILKRSGWIFLAVLFLATGLGVGVVAFWQATHPANDTNSPNSSSVSKGPDCNQDLSIKFNSETGSGKLAGAKLSDYTPVAHVSSLGCTDVKVGTGSQTVQSSSTIVATYTGALASTGVIFQSSLDNGGQPFSTALSGVIQGWQVGLIGVKAGGERRLMVPASLAYGSQAQNGIPANSDLVFDVTVIAIQ